MADHPQKVKLVRRMKDGLRRRAQKTRATTQHHKNKLAHVKKQADAELARVKLSEEARDRVALFERTLREEFVGESAIIGGVVESAVTSYRTMVEIESLQRPGSELRIEGIERTHVVLVDAQRNLFRAFKVLLGVQASPEYRAAALRRATASLPASTSDADRAAAEDAATKRLEENRQKFAGLGDSL